MPEKNAPKKTSLASTARPYLPLVIQQAAKEGRDPGEYFLLIGKYDPSRSCAVPRAIAGDTVAMARTPAQREKMERLLAKPCGLNQILVMITAGDYVEGELLRVPTLAPDPDKIFITQKELAVIEGYQALYGSVLADHVDKEGGRLGEYVAILRLPSHSPIILKRDIARQGLELCGFGPILSELDRPATNDDELLCVYMVKGKPTFSKLQFAPRAQSLGRAEVPGERAVNDVNDHEETPSTETAALNSLVAAAEHTPERAACDDARSALLAEWSTLQPGAERTAQLEAALALVKTATRMCVGAAADSGVREVKALVEAVRNGRVMPESTDRDEPAIEANNELLKADIRKVFDTIEAVNATDDENARLADCVDALVKAEVAHASAMYRTADHARGRCLGKVRARRQGQRI